MTRWYIAFALTFFCSGLTTAANPKLSGPAAPALKLSSVTIALGSPLIDSAIPLQEIQDYIDARIPRMPQVRSAAEWQAYADHARQQVLDHVVFRGEAVAWRRLATHVEWLDTIDGGPGYKIRKLRYEAVPGLWIPALLYEPSNLGGQKVPVSLAVNGHETAGKSIEYKQLRCINQAKRGMIVLNTEYLGMGQLTGENYSHYRMNQLDLCGTSGLAPFYLVMSRGLDVLLAHEHADPTRVTVQGLSGGGWQTITISSLDTRVTLCNPVAGYSSLRTRVRNVTDLGDSEQNAADLETVIDYAQMTAMLAPRPALLTYNFADSCCFKADHALPPLDAAARPIYELYGKSIRLRTYVNHVPGNHNYGLDNRQQFYAMLKDFFFSDRPEINATEIPSGTEVKTAAQLKVDLPPKNEDFHSLALRLAEGLPHDPALPESRDQVVAWQKRKRELLGNIVHERPWGAVDVTVGTRSIGSVVQTDRWLRIGDAWTVPAVEFVPANPKGDAIVLADRGRAKIPALIDDLVQTGRRVLAVDLYGFGESQTSRLPHLFAIALSSVGERPLGIQASQLAATARWFHQKFGKAPQIVADGPRSSLIATVAAALETEAIGSLELHGSFGSIKEVLEQNLTIEQTPELFCFGLLEQFDIRQLMALVAPRPVHFVKPSDRVQQELTSVGKVYTALGAGNQFDAAK